jgi:two-component system sensor histidine kinase YesM
MTRKASLLRSIRNYKFQSLFFKSLLLIFFLIIIPFLGMTLAIYSQMNRAVQTETSAVSMSNLQRVRDVMETIFYQMDHISLELINQSDVESFLRKPVANDFTSSQYQNIYDKIAMYTRTYAYIDSVYIYSDTNRYIISNRLSTTLDSFEDRTWQAQVYTPITEAAPNVSLRMRNDLYPYYISFTRPAYYFGQLVGAVTSNIDIEELRKFLDQSSLSADYLYIMNADNQIVYSHNRDDFKLFASEIPLLAQLNLSPGTQSGMKTIDGQNYIVTSLASQSDMQSWRYISLLPLSRYDQKLHNLKQSLYWFLAIGGVVLLSVSIFISLRSLSPINQIMSFIEEQEKVEFAMEWTERKGLNELKTIINSIFRTMDTKRILQQELQLRQQMLNKAQTTALQTQINPHFLYNTLESIKNFAGDF